MEKLETLHGTVEIKGIKCGFTLEDFILTIELQNGVDIGINRYDNSVKLPFTSLDGNIHNQASIVKMFFLDYGYGYNSIYRGFSTENIKIPVAYYMVLENNFFGKDISIRYANNSFNKWLNIVPVHKVKNSINEVTDNVSISNSACNNKNILSIKNKKYEISPGYACKSSVFSFDYKVSLDINCLENIEVKDIFDVSVVILKLVAFCFYRSEISLGAIEIYQKNENVTNKIGNFYFNYNEKEIIQADLDNYMDFGFIQWSILFKNVNELINLVDTNKIFLLNIPEKRKDRFICSTLSIPEDAAAFEYEFCRCFNDYRSENVNDPAHISLHNKIWSVDLTEDEEIILHHTDYLFNSPSLQERALYSLNYFDSVIKDYRDKLSNENIAEYFKNARHKVNHGKVESIIYDETARAYYVIRIVVMCMQLKRIGMCMDDIAKAIRTVFSRDCNRNI